MRDAAFAERLKLLRKTCNLTQQKMATALGIERSTYTYYETGKTFPDILSLARIAQIFNVTTDVLLGIEPVSAVLHDDTFLSDCQERFSQLSADEQILLLQFRAMTDEERQELFKTIQSRLNK